jgi:hypothetical protein
MFGREDDATNHGIAVEIENIRDRLEKTIDVLHDEDKIEFDRNEIEE